MSPLWRDEVGVYLSPQHVVLNRMQRGVRPQCVATECLGVEGGSFTNWAPAIATLQAAFQRATWEAAHVRLVIANAWTRYLLVPRESGLQDEREREALARLLMAQTFGDAGDDWKLSLAADAVGHAQLACAIPSTLLDSIHGSVANTGHKIVSLQPQLVVAFNYWRDSLPADCSWFVSLDEGSLAAARLTSNGWDQVRCVRIGSDWPAELRRLQTFARLASSGSAGGRVFVDAPLGLRVFLPDQAEGLVMLDHADRQGDGTLDQLVAYKGMQL